MPNNSMEPPGQLGVEFGAILLLAARAAHLEAVRRASPTTADFTYSSLFLYTRPMEEARGPRVDRTSLSIGRVSDPTDDLAYWLSRSRLDRLEAIEISRIAVYGYNPTSTRLRRLLEVTQLSRS